MNLISRKLELITKEINSYEEFILERKNETIIIENNILEIANKKKAISEELQEIQKRKIDFEENIIKITKEEGTSNRLHVNFQDITNSLINLISKSDFIQVN